MDAMSGWGELEDRALVEDLYGLGGLGGIQDWGTGADRADYKILDGVDWGGRGGLADGVEGGV